MSGIHANSPYVATGTGNYMLTGDDFKVSYRPHCRSAPLMCSAFAGDTEDETALVVDGNYYILNFDFRPEYAALAPHGKEACLGFFKAMSEQEPHLVSSWSDKL